MSGRPALIRSRDDEKNGKPLTKESFGNAFKDACRAAGIFNRSAHGCRKIAATRAAEAGATVAELNALFRLERNVDGLALHRGR
jgi:hypothetical protein